MNNSIISKQGIFTPSQDVLKADNQQDKTSFEQGPFINPITSSSVAPSDFKAKLKKIFKSIKERSIRCIKAIKRKLNSLYKRSIETIKPNPKLSTAEDLLSCGYRENHAAETNIDTDPEQELITAKNNESKNFFKRAAKKINTVYSKLKITSKEKSEPTSQFEGGFRSD